MKKIFIILLLLLLTGCSQPVDLGETRMGAILAIQDTIEIGDIEKTIDFTDENEGEDFIIKTDEKDYVSLGGGVIVNFSITNISKTDQDADVVFSLGAKQDVNYVKRFEGNREIITYTEKTATTTSKEIRTKEPIWEIVDFNSFDVSKSSLTRKDTKGREVDKTFKDTFKVGETKYYKSSIQVPLGITENEWFIEVFGQDYGHLDPNNWTYEEKFNDLTTGDLNGQDSWSGGTGYDVTTTAAAIYEGTKGVSETASLSIQRQITSIDSGTMYVSMKTNDANTNGGGYLILNNNAGLSDVLVNFWSDYTIRTLNDTQTAWIQVGSETWSADTWSRIGIQFRCTGAAAYEGLSERYYNISVDDGAWNGPYEMERSSGTNIEDIKFYRLGSSENYWDYVSYEYGGAVADPCEYSGTSDWYVYYSDNCYIEDDIYINGSFNLINDGAGSFGTIANISALIEEGTAKFNVDGNLPIQCNRPNTDCLSGHN